MTIQNYDINLAANGGTQIIEASAQVIDFLSSGSAFDQIQVFPDFIQGAVTLKLGQGFDAGKIVNRWLFKNIGTTAIAGSVVLSTAGFRNFRISGDVNVLDGSKSRAIQNVAFVGMNLTPAPGAGLLQHVQLWNPANSGKRLIVEQIETVSTVATGFNHYVTTAAISTANGQGNPKMFGGVQSVAGLLYKQSNAVSLWTGAEMLTNGPTNVTSLFKPVEPFVIPPGYGWGVVTQGANADLTVTWEWYEEPNT